MKKFPTVLILFGSIISFAGEVDRARLMEGFHRTEPFGDIGFSLKKCQTGEFGNQPAKSAPRHRSFPQSAQILDENCTPDTLYSWGSLEKVNALKALMGNQSWDSTLKAPLFATFLPVGTFYYGEVPVRIKLKEGLTFKEIGYNDCRLDKKPSKRKMKELRSTVYFDRHPVSDGGPNPRGAFLYEFVICSPEVIASWSYGLPEHFDETIRDLKWITDPANKNNFTSYIQLGNGAPQIDINFEGRPFVKEVPSWFTRKYKLPVRQEIDGLKVSDEVLLKNLAAFFAFAQRDRGEIFYNQNSTVDQTFDEHFKTTRPIYFND